MNFQSIEDIDKNVRKSNKRLTDKFCPYIRDKCREDCVCFSGACVVSIKSGSKYLSFLIKEQIDSKKKLIAELTERNLIDQLDGINYICVSECKCDNVHLFGEMM
jgi:hypothetical protein